MIAGAIEPGMIQRHPTKRCTVLDEVRISFRQTVQRKRRRGGARHGARRGGELEQKGQLGRVLFLRRRSIWPAVAVHEHPAAVRCERSPEVVIRIDHSVSGVAVADFEIRDLAVGAVDQVMGVTRPGLEPAHIPGRSAVSPALVTRMGSPSRI